jgi:hypothetical protein
VQRTLAAWLVALPAAAGGVLAAHAAAYGLAGDDADAAHGYLPLAEASVCALLALGLVAAALAARAAAPARPHALAFALAPPFAFLLQETAERGFALPLERVVLLGLALQLPFAVLAYLAARLLLRAAAALAPAPRRPRLRPLRPVHAWPSATAPRPALLLAFQSRGPPLSTAS